ncbi:hypothetical protein ACGFZL_15695 [Streptomyces sp. NPDC048182]|uniref:hypothetical protein n=1 Tax=Streptomyces sp. NPDC048182 TaxID=3365507 RepID=UPI003711A9C9
MIIVAVVLLPGLGLLLYAMTSLEDRMFAAPGPGPARHARKRHLRLLPGGRGDEAAAPGAADRERPARRSAERDAA